MEKNNTLDAFIHVSRTIVYAAILVFTYVFPAKWLTPAIFFVVTGILGATLLRKIFFEKQSPTLERALAVFEGFLMPTILVGHIEDIFNFSLGSWTLALALLNATMFVADCIDANKN